MFTFVKHGIEFLLSVCGQLFLSGMSGQFGCKPNHIVSRKCSYEVVPQVGQCFLAYNNFPFLMFSGAKIRNNWLISKFFALYFKIVIKGSFREKDGANAGEPRTCLIICLGVSKSFLTGNCQFPPGELPVSSKETQRELTGVYGTAPLKVSFCPLLAGDDNKNGFPFGRFRRNGYLCNL